MANYGYTPYSGYNYGYTPPYYNSTTQPQQTQPPINTNEIFVNGIEDVRNRALPVNSNYIFLDNDKALLYEKIVDSRGQFEVKTYEIREIKGSEATKDTSASNLSDFVKTSDLAPLKAEIETLKKQIRASIQNQVDNLDKGGR